MAKKKGKKAAKPRLRAKRPSVVERMKQKLASAKKRIAALSKDVYRLEHPSPLEIPAWVAGLLTPREWKVLRHFVDHPNDREIARILGTKPSTVRHQLASIERKLGVDSRNAILIYAHAHGPIPPSLGGGPE